MTLRTLFFTLFFALSGFALEIDPALFQSEVQRIAGKFPEFTYLKETAEKYGLKVYLFGGSASSFAHYVKENMLLEKGERNYYSYHFQESEGVRDITNVFRPTQDIDLVVDGMLENIKEFEREVLGHLPSLRGDSKSWEVRSLREDYGDKMALLHSFDFLNQHTDSHSVGLVAISDVAEDQVVRDLRDWNANSPRFLKDVLEGKLHYYYGESHHLTSRAKSGSNPPIFSVIRYFIKLFQHELIPHPEDREKIKAIIASFEPQSFKEGYTKAWLFKNIPKLFLQSKDVELSWNTLEEFGLREKLSQLGDINTQGNPAWWMNKSPLRSFELGRGGGKTASELGIKTVAHDTRDFYLWTVITASKKGRANMFESRQDTVGESAAYGRGVYTIKNSRKGWGNGFTIRFEMNPLAREGVDFKVVNDIVLILNRNALEVIPDSLEVASLMDYLQLIKKSRDHQTFLLERLKLKIDRHYYMNRDKPEIKKEIQKAIKFFKKHQDNKNSWNTF